MTSDIDRNPSAVYTGSMAKRALRLVLSVALFWTAMNVCLMPQADCEGKAPAPCACHHGGLPKCCHGVHLTEAGVGSGLSVAPAAEPFQQAMLPRLAAAPALASTAGESLDCAVPTIPRHPPPRESSGRSPPLA